MIELFYNQNIGTIIIVGGILGLLLIGLICGFDLAGGFSPAQKSDDLFQKGFFGINDIYHTCMYRQENGYAWDGYCYNSIPEKNKILEGCEIGCKLQTPYWTTVEDLNYCLNLCKENIKVKGE